LAIDDAAKCTYKFPYDLDGDKLEVIFVMRLLVWWPFENCVFCRRTSVSLRSLKCCLRCCSVTCRIIVDKVSSTSKCCMSTFRWLVTLVPVIAAFVKSAYVYVLVHMYSIHTIMHAPVYSLDGPVSETNSGLYQQ